VNAVKEALKGSDSAAIKSAAEKLNEAWQAVSAELYKAAAAKAQAEKGGGAGPAPEAGGQPGGEPPKSDEKKDEGVIDAEVVDEKKG
jgi:molecular chaperone DnaK